MARVIGIDPRDAPTAIATVLVLLGEDGSVGLRVDGVFVEDMLVPELAVWLLVGKDIEADDDEHLTHGQACAKQRIYEYILKHQSDMQGSSVTRLVCVVPASAVRVVVVDTVVGALCTGTFASQYAV